LGDLVTLKNPEAHLNDIIIFTYMNLLCDNLLKSESQISAFTFDSFFYPSLIHNGYESVKNWTSKVNLFKYSYVLVPIFTPGVKIKDIGHWTLVIINMIDNSINYFDSYFTGLGQNCIDNIKQYLKSELKNKNYDSNMPCDWISECVENLPKQNNSIDCGVFVCQYAKRVIYQTNMLFEAHEIPNLRIKMEEEIVKNTLDL